MREADFDLRENTEMVNTLKKYAESGDCPKDFLFEVALRLERTTKHLEFWVTHYLTK